MSDDAPKFKTFKPFADEQLCALEEAHRRIEVVRGAVPPAPRWRSTVTPEPPWEVVFRVPTEGESNAFEMQSHGADKVKSAALRNLGKAVVVAVSRDGKHTIQSTRGDREEMATVRRAWDDLREEHPGAHMAAQDALMSLNSMGREEAGKD